MPITREQAQDIAEAKVQELARQNDDDFQLASQQTLEREAGWLFFYNSREYLTTGDPLSALAGNGPIFVSSEGKLRQLSSAASWDDIEGEAA